MTPPTPVSRVSMMLLDSFSPRCLPNPRWSRREGLEINQPVVGGGSVATRRAAEKPNEMSSNSSRPRRQNLSTHRAGFEEGAMVFHESVSQTAQDLDQRLWRMAGNG